MKARLIAVGAAITCVTILLTLGAGEAIVRYRESHRTVVPGTMPTLFYRHARLRHALVRDFSYYGWAHVDSLGFRKSLGGGSPGSRRPTVLVMGGSTTFDTQVTADERAWPARVEAILGESAGGFAGDVINGGVPGYRFIDMLIRFETDLAELHPDLLLLYETHNDLYTSLGSVRDAGFTQRPVRAATLAPWTVWLEDHSLLYAKLAGRWQAIRSRGRGPSAGSAAMVSWDSVLDLAARNFERDVESLVAVAQARGIPVAVMTVTHVSATDSVVTDSTVALSWRYTVPGVPTPVVLEGYHRFADKLRQVARRRQIPLIDGASSGVTGAALYAEGDPIHFNDAGADRFARFVAGALTPLLAARPVGAGR